MTKISSIKYSVCIDNYENKIITVDDTNIENKNELINKLNQLCLENNTNKIEINNPKIKELLKDILKNSKFIVNDFTYTYTSSDNARIYKLKVFRDFIQIDYFYNYDNRLFLDLILDFIEVDLRRICIKYNNPIISINDKNLIELLNKRKILKKYDREYYYDKYNYLENEILV